MDSLLHKIQTGFDLGLQALADIPTRSWYIFGSFVALGILVSVVVEAILLYKQYKSAEKVAKKLTTYIVVLVTGFSALIDYYLTNSQVFLPFMGSAYATIYMTATKWHVFFGNKWTQKVMTAITDWLKGRKTIKKSIFTTDLGEEVDEPEAAPKSPSLFS